MSNKHALTSTCTLVLKDLDGTGNPRATTQASVEWTLSGAREGAAQSDGLFDGYLASDATSHYGDFEDDGTFGTDADMDGMGMDCGDFDDCSAAYASADAFAIF